MEERSWISSANMEDFLWGNILEDLWPMAYETCGLNPRNDCEIHREMAGRLEIFLGKWMGIPNLSSPNLFLAGGKTLGGWPLEGWEESY